MSVLRPLVISLGLAVLPAAAALAAESPLSVQALASLPHDMDGEIRRADQLRLSGDYPGAIKSFAQLMLVGPDDPRIVGGYGKSLVQAGRAGEAIDFFKRALQLSPNDWTLYSALGVAHDALRQPKDANIAYRHALALKPGEASVLNNLALSLVSVGNLAEAESLLREAAAQGDSDPRIAENLNRIAQQRAARTPAPGQPQSAMPPSAWAQRAPQGHPPGAMAKQPRLVQSAPRSLLPGPAAPPARQAAVIMQKVPYDPLAGKHYPAAELARAELARERTKRVTRLAGPMAPREQTIPRKKEQKSADNGPVLRTAADVY